MKKTMMIGILSLLLFSTTVSMAQPGRRGGRMGPEGGMGPQWLSNLNLTTEQAEKIRALRESHMKEVTPLRTQLFTKRAEMKVLWIQTDPDSEKIKAKFRELHVLQGQLREKDIDQRLALINILTPEQRSELLARGFQGRRWGKGRGHGFSNTK